MENEFDKELGFRLRTLRQMRRMSQKALGEVLGVSFQQIQKYETGANRLSPECIDKCARVFDVPVGYFFGREGQVYAASFDKRVMTIAATIASLPSPEVVNKIYHLALVLAENEKEKHTG